MKKLALSLALAVLAGGGAQAQSADLSVEINGVSPFAHAGEMFYGNVFVHNLGPDTARNVVVTQKVDGWPEVVIPCGDGHCSLGDLATPGIELAPRVAQALPVRDFDFTMTVTVSSDTADPHPENNSATVTVHVTTAPQLQTFMRLPVNVEPGHSFDLELDVTNSGLAYAVAHDVVVTLDLPSGVGVDSLPAPCSAAGAQVKCTVAQLDPNFGFPQTAFALRLTAPPRYEGGDLQFHAAATAREGNFGGLPAESTGLTTMYRTFFVTTTADHGSGSLRAALQDANAACPILPACDVRFNIAEPSDNPWKTIKLDSPLPRLRTQSLRIDGATQTVFSGVANPDGPPVELSGGGTVDGDGLLVNCYAEIAHLAINGFRRNGISLTQSPDITCTCRFNSCSIQDLRASIHDNFIGTDPTGSAARPNDRGIGVAESDFYFPMAVITNNVISGNAKSGVYAIGGSIQAVTNRVGLKAHTDEPLPNGGSGFYVGPLTTRIELLRNLIAFNGQWGVAIHPAATTTSLAQTQIWSNGAQAIDDGLDGPSRVAGNLATPVITQATYDGRTVISGTSSSNVNVFLYDSDTPGKPGSGDLQHYLGQTCCGPTFQFIAKDLDLRGRWITAVPVTGVANPFADVFTLFRCGEPSAAVQVH